MRPPGSMSLLAPLALVVCFAVVAGSQKAEVLEDDVVMLQAQVQAQVSVERLQPHPHVYSFSAGKTQKALKLAPPTPTIWVPVAFIVVGVVATLACMLCALWNPSREKRKDNSHESALGNNPAEKTDVQGQTDFVRATSSGNSQTDHSRQRHTVEYEPDTVRERLRYISMRTFRSTVTAAMRKTWVPEMSHGTMSGKVLVVNMVADVLPAGFLPVACGIDTVGYVWTFLLVIAFWFFCVFTMWLSARNCVVTGSTELDIQWGKVVGRHTRWVPLVANVVCTFGDLIAFTCFFGAMISDVLPRINIHASREICITMFSIFPVLPLCLLKDFSTLAPSSTLGILAVAYTIIAMCIRTGDGSYAVGGKYYNDLKWDHELMPELARTNHLLGVQLIGILRLLNTLSLSFLAHYNACKYYSELKDATPTRYAKLCSLALSVCMGFYIFSMIAGFKTFGHHAEEMILANYASEDMLINAARIATGFSLMAAYPVTFCALRESAISILKIALPGKIMTVSAVMFQDCLSTVFVGLVIICAVNLKDERIVVGLVGAVCGVSVIFIVPTVLHVWASKSGLVDREKHRILILFTKFLLCLGAFLMVAGFVSTLFLE
mmetsp:Transcript_81399/g.174239  ORF Transcript_81399/g.174239 Transcript_81399/m.174239 type:complete len:606 (-) Transcript_81399:34-1851(-)